MLNSSARRRGPWTTLALAFACVLASAGASVAAQTGQISKKADASDALFAKGLIPELKIQIDPPELEKLLKNTREYVRCSIREGEKIVHKDMALKLKGAAGSYQEFDQKPAFTIRCSKFGTKDRFHALDKFHLNNSVQDDTYLHEWTASYIFRAAGIATPRVTHARVWVNGRDLGIYVLKEGFDENLLSRYYKNHDGDLYDGGFCQDIDADLEKDQGRKKDDRANLIKLRETATITDPKERAEKLQKILDIPTFQTFTALELMLGHWDGYSQSRNNYRLYFDPASGKACFLPHGMDQVLGDPEAPILDMPAAIVSSAMLKIPLWRAAWRKRVKELIPLFDPEKVNKELEVAAARVESVIRGFNPEEAGNYKDRARGLRERIAARFESLKKQIELPEPKPVVLQARVPQRLKNWHPMSESEDAKLVEESPTGEKLLTITCGKSGSCVASWRTNLLLPKGKYTITGKVRVDGVAPLENEKPGGATLRTSGADNPQRIPGTAKWTDLSVTVEVLEAADNIEFVAELRASKGKASFKLDSLQITKN